jgi:hypothetical protein
MEDERPRRQPKSIKATYRWSEEEYAILEELATDMGLTHSQVLRYAIRELRRQRRRRNGNGEKQT